MKNNGLDIDIAAIERAQKIARYCLDSIPQYLKSGMTREEIHEKCEELMTAAGSTGWWTHGDAALILFGNYLTYSAHEDPASLFDGVRVGENDVITIDVAPMYGIGWGDMARTFVIENGICIPWEKCTNSEVIEGMRLEQYLQNLLRDTVNEETTFSDIHRITQRILDEKGYRNCDYHGNFGHSIEIHPDNRVTIIPNENRRIAEYGKPVTYEPHICKIGGTIGVKHENMYRFINGHMTVI